MNVVNNTDEPRFAAFVAIDWGDSKHAWSLQPANGGGRERGEIEHSPEAVGAWVLALGARFGGQPIAVAMEQSRGALVFMLGRYEQMHIYPIHPRAASQFRGALFPSGAKDDPVESPRRYSFSNLPRSITWSEVERMLRKVDRRSPVGKRDYAILLLLVTYGLRAREVGALTLDDIDWKRDHLHIRGRKAGHSTAYPLAPPVGEALLEYLKQGHDTGNLQPILNGMQQSRCAGQGLQGTRAIQGMLRDQETLTEPL